MPRPVCTLVLVAIAMLCTGSALDAQQPARRPGPVRRPAAAPAPAPAAAAPAAEPTPPAPLPPAQPVSRTPLFLVAASDSIYIFIDSVAPRGHGWRVTRGDGTLIAEGLEPERASDRIAERLGDDLPLARRLTRAEDDVGLLRRLLSDRAVNYTGFLLSHRIAAATGRLAVDGAPLAGNSTGYRAELVRRADGAVRTSFMARAVARGAAPATDLRADALVEGVRLQWRYPRYSGDPADVTVGFLIERAIDGGPWQLLVADAVLRDDARIPAWLDADVVDGARYQYRILPVLMGGFAAAPGPAITVTMRDRLAPLAPLGAATDVQDGKVRIVWASPPDADLAGFQIERRKGGNDSTWVRLHKELLPPTRLEFVDSTVRGSTIYAWRVRAVDAAGNVGPWGTPTTGRAEERTPPDAPRALAAKLSARRHATYTWQPPIANDISGYHIYRTSGNGTRVRLTGLPVPQREFVDSAAEGAGLVPGAKYVIDVSAVDSSANESVPASLALTVPDDEAPDAPRTLSARGRFGGAVTLTWTKSPSLDIARYEVAVATGPEGVARPVGQTGGAGPFVLTDTTAVNDLPLDYRVVAVDSAGNRSPAATFAITLKDEERPSAPRAVWAVRKGPLVRLGWERVMSRDLVGYVVLRTESIRGTLTEVARLGPDVREFVDREAPANVYYAVRAVDRSGNTSIPQALTTPVTGEP